MRIVLEDGPKQGDTFEVTESLFDSGYIRVPVYGRATGTLSGICGYARHRYFDGQGAIVHRWLFEGWE